MNLSGSPFGLLDMTDPSLLLENSLFMAQHTFQKAFPLKQPSTLFPHPNFLKAQTFPTSVSTAAAQNLSPNLSAKQPVSNKRPRPTAVNSVMRPTAVNSVMPNCNMAADTIHHLIQEQNLKKRRLARKAELARLSRRRKKERLSVLEDENKVLLEEIARLKQQHQDDQKKIQEQAKQLQAMGSRPTSPQPFQLDSSQDSKPHDSKPFQGSSLSRSSSIEANMNNIVDDMICFDRLCSDSSDVQSDNSTPDTPNSEWSAPTSPDISSVQVKSEPADNIAAQKQQGMSLQNIIASLRSLLGAADADTSMLSAYSPVQIDFLKWVFCQKEQFYEAKDGLWRSIFEEELSCSHEQLVRLNEARAQAVHTKEAVGQLEQVLLDLQRSLLSQSSACQANIEQLCTILSESQMKNLLSWIERFGGVCLKIKV